MQSSGYDWLSSGQESLKYGLNKKIFFLCKLLELFGAEYTAAGQAKFRPIIVSAS